MEKTVPPAISPAVAGIRRQILKRRSGKALAEWADHFLRNTLDSVFAAHPAARIADAVQASYDCLRRRRKGEIKVLIQGNRLILLQDDRPFLVRSLKELLRRAGLRTELMIHPIVAVRRDASGRLTELTATHSTQPFLLESLIYIEASAPFASGFERQVLGLMKEIRECVAAFPAMHAELLATADALGRNGKGLPREDVAEARDFLEWLANGNFVLLGCLDSGVQLAYGRRAKVRRALITPPAGPLLDIRKTRLDTAVYRGGRMIQVTVRVPDARGRVGVERHFLGHFADHAENTTKNDLPVLRRKYEQVRRAFRAMKNSYDDKELARIYCGQPLDTLLLTRAADLVKEFELMLAEVSPESPLVTARYDAAERAVVVTLAMAQERYRPAVRKTIEKLVPEMVKVTGVDSRVNGFFSQHGTVRLRCVFATERADVDLERIERAVRAAIGSWHDRVAAVLAERRGEAGRALAARFAACFDDAYQVLVSPAEAAGDIEVLAGLGESLAIGWGEPDRKAQASVLRLFSPRRRLTLSELTPILVNHGFTVEEEEVFTCAERERQVFLHVFRLKSRDGRLLVGDAAGAAVIENILAAYEGKVVDDSLAGLVVTPGLASREVELLRAIRDYAGQVRALGARGTFNRTLLAHPQAARLLVQLFHARFAPPAGDKAAAFRLARQFEKYLAGVSSIADDRILRLAANIIESMLRTNYFVDQAGNPFKSGIATIAFKLDCARVLAMPEPRPWREIFVYGGPVMVGCHLRGGPVARGGIRWSERPDDFRTEVLGLMKTQVTKNAQIVPTGAKGGFIVKRNVPREQRAAEVKRCYGIFISSCCDLADNIVGDAKVHPKNVVALDGDDPYFVVAADKGTATFSDFANSISAHYGLWIGDAFASGGSNGYDHKAEGITARGAWVSIERHFRELGRDLAREPITVAGIGDMSGDVFGNGLIHSPRLKLVAAFDHRDIFLDPEPDPKKSYAERVRLFRLPRSSWQDYDRRLISRGGGVFSRSLKSIPLSPEARRALGVAEPALDPDALIRAILRAPVDLLYNGGIGTYVKSTAELNVEVGDPQNDLHRVNGAELRARVVGEGGNLGFTQAGRIEYALKGGCLYSDAVDNSGGVDCSDHEVNLKILLDGVKGMTPQRRSRYLRRFNHAVIQDVLHDNYLQSLSISLDERRSRTNVALFGRMIAEWEKRKLIDRALEQLPDEDQLRDRRQSGLGLTKPELYVLMAWAKIDMKRRLLDSNLIGRPHMSRYAAEYFSPELRREFGKEIAAHRLKNDIVATVVTNTVVNFHGSTLLFQLTNELGLAASRVVEAVLAARQVLEADAITAGLFALDGKLPAAAQYDELLLLDRTVRLVARWLVKNVPDLRGRIEAGLRDYDRLAERCQPLLGKILPPDEAARMAARRDSLSVLGLPPALAERLAFFDNLPTLLDARCLALQKKSDLVGAARLLYTTGDRLRLPLLIENLGKLPVANDWDLSAVENVIADLRLSRRRITERVLDLGVSVDRHLENNSRSFRTVAAAIARIENEQPQALAPYLVLANQISNLAAL